MSESDDIDKLLREIDAMNKGRATPGQPAVPAASTPPGLPATQDVPSGGGSRAAWTGMGAVGGLVAGGVVGTVLTFLPAVSTVSTALGAALGGAIVAFVSRPPKWFDGSK